jgi:hypothetical protein
MAFVFLTQRCREAKVRKEDSFVGWDSSGTSNSLLAVSMSFFLLWPLIAVLCIFAPLRQIETPDNPIVYLTPV